MYIPATRHEYSKQTHDKPPSNRLLLIVVAIFLFLWAISHCSCTTAKNAPRKAENLLQKYPEKVVPVFRQAYPCITTAADTFITLTDTVINVDCPDTSAAQYFTVHDTLTHIKQVTKTISIPYRIQLPGRTVVKYIEDSAKIYEMGLRIKRIEAEREAAKAEAKATGEKLHKARKTRNWLWLLLFGATVWITRKLWLPVVGRMVNPLS
jgi:hypothetical protein